MPYRFKSLQVLGMKIAVMQPYFFPYVGYFQLIAAVDKFVVFDDVNYINRGWINRNNILVGGKSVLVTLPLKEVSQNKKIYEIDTTSDAKLIDKLVKTVMMNYKKAPFFEPVFTLIQQIFSNKSGSIAELNTIQLKSICAYLNIGSHLVTSSRFYNNDHLKGQDRIMDICNQENADIYINPIGGTELYKRENFEQKGIQLFFIKSQMIEYRQFNHPFVPWLSIIDVLMFNSVEQTREILKQYQLV